MRMVITRKFRPQGLLPDHPERHHPGELAISGHLSSDNAAPIRMAGDKEQKTAQQYNDGEFLHLCNAVSHVRLQELHEAR